ncbi:hypothetical protein HT574_12695 [Parageobacillus sp. VR-IP]|nr:hypothetical protein [Parageobacillus sp. VR-IP]
MIYNRPPIFPSSPMPRSFLRMPPSSFPAMRTPAPRPGFGGFLSRLFSRGQPIAPSSPWISPMMQNAVASTGAGANTGGGFLGMLTNVQKMLGIAQNVMPMVQQYGPLIKNLPAMIRIWKELKPADEEESMEESKTEKNKKKTAPSTKKRTVPKAEKTNENKGAESEKTPKPSTPKLYI